MLEYNLENGFEIIFELIGGVKEKPVVVGIYGHTNGGKTHLKKLCFKRTWEMGLVVNGGMVDDERAYAQNKNPDYIFVEDYIIPFRKHSIPFVSKPMDITVLIRNDTICHPEDHTWINSELRENAYDIRINNPDSKRK